MRACVTALVRAVAAAEADYAGAKADAEVDR